MEAHMILRFASLNVLAVAYLGNGEYTKEALKFLRSEERIPRLVELITSLEADVIGLQEVEPDLFNALETTGMWQTFWSPKRGKAEGTTLLVRNAVDVRDDGSQLFSDRSGHGWQYVILSNGITVVNTHIKWEDEDAVNHAGVNQVEELLRYIPIPAVILADCNGRPGGRVRTLFTEAGYRNVWGNAPTALVVKNGAAEHAPIDLIAVRGLQAEPYGTLPSVADIPNRTIPSDHVPITANVYTVE
jgi:endonuclease/exonuclease/phosphatase family metal-dependent hydrolase